MFVGIATASIFVEAMFRVPGMGAYFVSSIDKRDYPLEMALMLLITMLFCISYLVSRRRSTPCSTRVSESTGAPDDRALAWRA